MGKAFDHIALADFEKTIHYDFITLEISDGKFESGPMDDFFIQSPSLHHIPFYKAF